MGKYGSKEVLSSTENNYRPNTQGELVYHINFEPCGRTIIVSQKWTVG